jgi:hypothetical protein
LDDQFLGKKARCKQCRAYFVVSGHASPTRGDEVEARDDERARISAQAPVAAPPPEETSTRPLRKKKRRKPLGDPSLRLRIGLAVGVGVVVIGILIAVPLLLYRSHGGSHKTPDLVGKWKGAPPVREEVADALKGSNAPPLAGKLLGALGQRAADHLLAVNVQFNKSGAAFFSGNTSSIGVSGESDGTWEIVQAENDVLTVRMGPAKAPFEARLVFRDRDSFSFTRLDRKDDTSILFTRVVD